jgi:membrane protease YdiL (CAAX protease family)
LSPTETDTPFRRYVSLARTGRWGIPSILIGTVLTALLWVAFTLAVLYALFSVRRLTIFDSLPHSAAGFEAVFEGRGGVLVTLLTVGGLWAVMWIVLRLVHRRRLPTLFGASRRIDLGDGAKALLAGITILAIISLAMPQSDHLPFLRSSVAMSEWLLLLLPVAGLIAVQCSAEELVFRGYLVQSLAARFASPLVWALIPLLLFTAGHWDPDASLHMLVANLTVVGMFAAVATLLVIRTGNLGAAIGVHIATNLFAFLLTSPAGYGDSFALYTYPALSDPRWTVTDASAMVAVEAAYLLATLALLLHPRSPLCIGEKPAERIGEAA